MPENYSPYLADGVVPLIATDEDLQNIPNPNNSGEQIGEPLPDDWKPNGDS